MDLYHRTPKRELLAGLLSREWHRACALIAPKPSGPWIAGGAVRREISGATQDSDFDVIFRDECQLELLATKLGESTKMVERGSTSRFRLFYERTERGEPLTIPLRIQLLRWYGTIEEVLNGFDFSVCQFAFDGKSVIHTGRALVDLGERRLVLNRLGERGRTAARVVKYARQGFRADPQLLEAILRDAADYPHACRDALDYPN